ncbi:MAG: fibrobacter succinogenes major paralogous domain-containing protein [Bacteroidales bacterium]
MKSKLIYIIVLLVTGISYFFEISCQKLDFENVTKSDLEGAILKTGNIVSITLNVKELSIKEHPDFGICYSNRNTIPTIDDEKASLGSISKSQTVTKDIENLIQSKNYYFRGYVMDGDQPVYSLNTYTLRTYTLPLVQTKFANHVSYESATLNAEINPNTKSAVFSFEYGLDENYGQSVPLITTGINSTIYTSVSADISGLSSNTEYHFRIKAECSEGNSCGADMTFKTKEAAVPEITTAWISYVSTSSALCGGNVISERGAPVTKKGVCWGISQNPTIFDYKTSDGIGTGSFMSTITGLEANKTYYVRAYATSSAGTAYGNQLILKTYTSSITDIEGNNYYTVTIGDQIWIAENLKTTKYTDGTDIPNITNGSEWANLISPGYSWLNNDPTLKTTYGALYNWYALDKTSNGSKDICPVGWHLPSNNDWEILINYLGGNAIAGGKLKESGFSHWTSDNTESTNESGFTALPGGYRHSSGGFSNPSLFGYFWSLDENSANSAWYWFLYTYQESIGCSNDFKKNGNSVRCIKD